MSTFQNTFILSVNKLKSTTDIDVNVDTNVLQYSIRLAEKIDLQEIIGTKLLTELYTSISTSAVTSDQQVLLLDYIQPYLIEKSYSYALEKSWAKVKNAGLINQGNSETSNVVGYNSGMKSLVDSSLNRASWLGERIKKYLCNNTTLFPSYNDTTNNSDLLPGKSYNLGIYTKK